MADQHRRGLRIDVSKEVHARLKPYGHSFVGRVDNLLSADGTIQQGAEVVKPIVMRKAIYISLKAFDSLTRIMKVSPCMSMSNLLETFLNANPKISMEMQTKMYKQNVKAEHSLKIGRADAALLAELAKSNAIPRHVMLSRILESYMATKEGEAALKAVSDLHNKRLLKL